jgi:hypothetical protein
MTGKYTEEEIERARKSLQKTIRLVGARGFLTKKQVSSLNKKLKKA